MSQDEKKDLLRNVEASLLSGDDTIAVSARLSGDGTSIVATHDGVTHEMPIRFLERLRQMNDEMSAVVGPAERDFVNPLAAVRFRLRLTNSAAEQDITTVEERVAMQSFLLKLGRLPILGQPQIAIHGDEYHLANEPTARLLLHELRPIFFNQNEPTFYPKIHNLVGRMLAREGPHLGTKIEVLGDADVLLTDAYMRWMGAAKKVVSKALSAMDLDYLYNGVLQHSDSRFHERYSDDLYTGEIAWVLFRNAHILLHIKQYLEPYSVCTRAFWVGGGPRQRGI